MKPYYTGCYNKDTDNNKDIDNKKDIDNNKDVDNNKDIDNNKDVDNDKDADNNKYTRVIRKMDFWPLWQFPVVGFFRIVI
jgi:hypothetical protein